MAKRKRRTSLSVPQKALVIGVFLVAISVVLGFFLIPINRPITNQPLRIEKVFIPKVLTTTLGTFDSLQTNDLPKTDKIRGIFPYNNNLIFVTLENVFEYDPSTKQIVRLVDHSKFRCHYSATKINDYLYTSCHEGAGDAETFRGYIYKIDLRTGDAVEKISAPDKEMRYFINLSLASNGETLWIAGNENVFKINTKTNRVRRYDRVANNVCTGGWIYANENYVWVDTSPGCDFIQIYDEENDAWMELQEKVFSYPGRQQLRTIAYDKKDIYVTNSESNEIDTFIAVLNKDNKWEELVDVSRETGSRSFNALKAKYIPNAVLSIEPFATKSYFFDKSGQTASIDLEKERIDKQYYAISNIVNNKRYLVGDKIYIVTKNTFPEVKYDVDLLDNIRDNTCISNGNVVNSRAYVDPNERYMIVIQNVVYCELVVQLFDMKKNEQTILYRNNQRVNSNDISEEVSSYFFNNANEYFKYSFNNKQNSVVIVDDRKHKELMEINFEEKELSFKQ